MIHGGELERVRIAPAIGSELYAYTDQCESLLIASEFGRERFSGFVVLMIKMLGGYSYPSKHFTDSSAELHDLTGNPANWGLSRGGVHVRFENKLYTDPGDSYPAVHIYDSATERREFIGWGRDAIVSYEVPIEVNEPITFVLWAGGREKYTYLPSGKSFLSGHKELKDEQVRGVCGYVWKLYQSSVQT